MILFLFPLFLVDVVTAAFVPLSQVVALLQEEIRTRCTFGIWATSNVLPEFPRAPTVASHLLRYHAKRRHFSLQLVRSGPARRREIWVRHPPLVLADLLAGCSSQGVAMARSEHMIR